MPLDICLVTRDSNVMWYNVPLRIMRGTKKNDMIGDTFKTISDKLLKVKIQQGTQPDQQIKLSGHGMPIPRSNRYGDQIILLKPLIPATIEKEIVDAIIKYKDIQDLKSNK